MSMYPRRVDFLANRLKQAGVWLLVGLLIGCSPTFAYRHADWLILWKIDDYFDLTGEQKAFLRGRLKEVLARHRHEALPVYERFLTEIKKKSSDGLNRDEVDWVFSTYQQLRADLFERIVADGTFFLTSVDTQQTRHLEEAFREDNARAEHLVNETAETRLAKRATATLNWLKDWLGTLTLEQKNRIAALSVTLPDIEPVWVQYQKQRQQEILNLLRSTPSSQAVSQQLRDWLLFPERSAPPDYRRAFEHMRIAVKEMVLSVDGMITPQQRARALARLQDLINDVHALATS